MGKLQLLPHGHSKNFDETYYASPSSTRLAINHLHSVPASITAMKTLTTLTMDIPDVSDTSKYIQLLLDR